MLASRWRFLVPLAAVEIIYYADGRHMEQNARSPNKQYRRLDMSSTRIGLVAISLVVAGSFAASPALAAGPAAAHADLGPASGSAVSGTVNLSAVAGGVHFDVKASGLKPGVHGFHVHEIGDCSAPDASSAKGHFNPAAKPHGQHAGDLPDLTADASGNAILSADVSGIELGDGATSILNRAVVIHADPDDHTSQPAGNSGKRIACGVIKAS
jgi:superoxide dismutase, Cu-Zn family